MLFEPVCQNVFGTECRWMLFFLFSSMEIYLYF